MNMEQQGPDLGDIVYFDDDIPTLPAGDTTLTTLGDEKAPKHQTSGPQSIDDITDFSLENVYPTKDPDNPEASIKSPNKKVSLEDSLYKENQATEYLKNYLESNNQDTETITIEGVDYKVDDLNEDQVEAILESLDPNYTPSPNGLDQFAEIKSIFEEAGIEGLVEYLKENNYLEEEKTEVPEFESYVEKLEDTELLELNIRQECPECSESEIEDYVYRMATSPNKRFIKNIREKLLLQEKEEYLETVQEAYSKIEQDYIEQVQYIEDAANEINNIAGYEISSDIKEDIIPYITEVAPNDDTALFISEIMNDPKELFKAAFWYKYGDQVVNDYENELKRVKETSKIKQTQKLPEKPRHYFGETREKSSAKSAEKGSQRGLDISDYWG